MKCRTTLNKVSMHIFSAIANHPYYPPFVHWYNECKAKHLVCVCVCVCSDLPEDTESGVTELGLAHGVESTLDDGHHRMHVETGHDSRQLECTQPRK